ncbi:peptidase M12 [Hymenobacter aquaticus]|uniref:Peptidase M12 n=1 Tax=Hymenobacter aquaticus TaxID=1867101 RepID=A0A4Z0PTD0_9BACT|nr:M12 family metallopeptidase [Hymenobacter aquaticus]TGE20556.1 peptidase M12 [Hymenobacter aquaticus]
MSTHNDADDQDDVKPCTLKALPDRLKLEGIRTALAVNPLNGFLPTPPPNGHRPTPPMRLTAAVAKKWDDKPRILTVSFPAGTARELQDRIVSHMNAWTKTCCIGFQRVDKGGKVRVSFGPGGYWSYLGTDILLIPADEQTMNLEGFSMQTPESEFVRVVRHEAGHTLGFEHEHMRQELVDRIDRQSAYAYFLQTQGWDQETVDDQVLTPLAARSIIGTKPDETSIMCYQLPGKIMKNKKGIPGGKDINATDYAFAGRLYPKPKKQPAAEMAMAAHGDGVHAEGWPEAKDIRFSADLLAEFNHATLVGTH